MKFSDQTVWAAKNLSRRKGRTFLTLTGIVIGTCMVVVLISLGLAQNKNNEEMLESWGDLTQIEIWGSGYSATGEVVPLNDESVEKIQKMDNVVAATPYAYAYSLQASLTAGKNDRYESYVGSNLLGIYPEALEPMGFALEDGEWLPQGASSKNATKLPVLVCTGTGYNFEDTRKSPNSQKRYRWQGQTDAQGNELPPFVDVYKDKMKLTITNGETTNEKTRTWELEVVGTLASDPAKGWWTQNGIVMRLKDMQMVQDAYRSLIKDHSQQNSSYDEVYVKVDEVGNVDSVLEALEEMGFSNTYSMTQQREQMQANVMRSQLIMGSIAAVSLFVAALNIINTMTMAIYERTKEIGVMKVLGCKLGDIRRMFLVESGCLGFLGGVVGIIISVAVSFGLNNLNLILSFLGIEGNVDLSNIMGGGYYYGGGGGSVSIVPPWLLAAALAFATLIGLVAGIMPANRAMRISALEAIRHD